MEPHTDRTMAPPPAQPARPIDRWKRTRPVRHPGTTIVAVLAVVMLLLSACEITPTRAKPVRSMDQVAKAVIRIEVEGRFRALGEEQVEGRGFGSGFFIDGSGLAVTNNHVVTGASLLRVYLDGEEGYRNARVVAVSECSDLALIQVEGEIKYYFEWYDGEISTALAIYVAGFPRGTQEITTVEGIISKAKANGQTTWASVESVIEHTATPGRS